MHGLNSRNGLTLGISLVEILFVLGIVIVLATLVMPALIGAKRQSKVAVDISNLRQIGMAVALYREQFDALPYRSAQLAAGNFVPIEILCSPNDPSEEGFANVLTRLSFKPKSFADTFVTKYKSSYVGFGDVSGTELAFDLTVAPFENPGLFVALSYDAMRTRNGAIFKGAYYRLLLDGSVQRRAHRIVSGEKRDRTWRGATLVQLFADHPEDWLRQTIFGAR